MTPLSVSEGSELVFDEYRLAEVDYHRSILVQNGGYIYELTLEAAEHKAQATKPTVIPLLGRKTYRMVYGRLCERDNLIVADHLVLRT